MTKNDYCKDLVKLMTKGIKGGLSLEQINFLTVFSINTAAAYTCKGNKKNGDKEDTAMVSTILTLFEPMNILAVLAGEEPLEKIDLDKYQPKKGGGIN